MIGRRRDREAREAIAAELSAIAPAWGSCRTGGSGKYLKCLLAPGAMAQSWRSQLDKRKSRAVALATRCDRHRTPSVAPTNGVKRAAMRGVSCCFALADRRSGAPSLSGRFCACRGLQGPGAATLSCRGVGVGLFWGSQSHPSRWRYACVRSALAPCGIVLCGMCRARRMPDLVLIGRARGPWVGGGQVCPWRFCCGLPSAQSWRGARRTAQSRESMLRCGAEVGVHASKRWWPRSCQRHGWHMPCPPPPSRRLLSASGDASPGLDLAHINRLRDAISALLSLRAVAATWTCFNLWTTSHSMHDRIRDGCYWPKPGHRAKRGRHRFQPGLRQKVASNCRLEEELGDDERHFSERGVRWPRSAARQDSGFSSHYSRQCGAIRRVGIEPKGLDLR